MTRASCLTAIVVAAFVRGGALVAQGPSADPPLALELTAGKTLIEMELKNEFPAGP